MSLDPRDSQKRGRSKSPGGRDEREKSTTRERSRVRDVSPPTRGPGGGGGYDYDYSDRRGGNGGNVHAEVITAEPRGSYGSLSQYQDHSSGPAPAPGSYAMPGAFGAEDEGDRDKGPRYSVAAAAMGGAGRGGREKEYYPDPSKGGYGGGYGQPVAPPRSQYENVDQYQYKDPRHPDEPKRERGASFNVSAGSHSISGAVNLGGHGSPQPPYSQPQGQFQQPSPADFQYPGAPPPGRQYADPKQWEYAQPSDKLTYSKQETITNYSNRPASPAGQQYAHGRHGSQSYAPQPQQPGSGRSSQTNILTVDGPDSRRRAPSPGPAGLAPRMHSLSVSTGHHGGAALTLAAAPGSPLLEAYHGTYQSISPMPSPLMGASHGHGHHGDINYIEPLSPSSSDDDRHGARKPRRTARFHDPVDEATILAKALKGEKRAPDTQPLIEILPGLTHEQVLDLRVEYKRIVKTGSEKKGVNIAKHIKLRLKDEDPSLMKACYACALGRWESEAYWANFWYQGEKSRRELLIESLMGRTNKEIRAIKDGFADKKYGDSLVKCMKTELKEDKFKKAVLMVLEERKMEDHGGRVDRGLVEDDVRELYRAVKSEKGGESAMIAIVVVRSEGHLREVLRVYEASFKANFAREMLKKSGNLVGEMLAHILNGVINKPVRDALLIHHALSLSKSDAIRTELLISRLVRYHWDRPHMESVKREYRSRYGVDMQVAVREGTRGEWGHFLEGLCVRRMGDEVRRFGEQSGGGGGGGRGDGYGRERGRDEYGGLTEREYAERIRGR